MAKTEISHTDIFGNPLSLGACVIATRSNDLYVCSIIKITPKQVRVKKVSGNDRYSSQWLAYPSNVVLADEMDAVAYKLKNGC